ncbi:hypothetical protein Tco_0658090 [Tanacetum coccineum]
MKADPQLQQQAIAIWLALQMKFETLQVPQTTCRTFVVRPRDQDDPHDDAHPEGENSAKRQKTSEYEGHVTRESSGQVNEEKEVQGLRRYCCHFTSFLQLSSIIFNPYARYGVEHWKNPHAKIFYIKMQKELGKPNEVVYSNSKIIQVIKTSAVVFISFHQKFSDMGRVHDFQLGIESYQQKVNLTAPTISFPGIEKHKMFSIIYEPVHGIIYKNSKKEKRMMRHSEIHKFCDATLNRVLEGLKSYNNDVKYGYIQRDLTEDEVEYLKLFEEEIEVRLKYRNQMRRWEMYVNGRPLGPRRERPE